VPFQTQRKVRTSNQTADGVQNGLRAFPKVASLFSASRSNVTQKANTRTFVWCAGGGDLTAICCQWPSALPARASAGVGGVAGGSRIGITQ